MNDTDPTLPSYLVEVRVSRAFDAADAGPFCAYAPRLGNAWAVTAATERDALGAICQAITGVIRACRKAGNRPIPWLPANQITPISKRETVRRCAINMPTPTEEELWRVLDDEVLIARLVEWEKKDRSCRANKAQRKQQRKVAVRLHGLGYVKEAHAIMRRASWASWHDVLAVRSAVKKSRSARATMGAWWRSFHEWMQDQWMMANPSYVDKVDDWDQDDAAVKEIVGEYQVMDAQGRRQRIESSLALDDVQASRDAAETERRKRNREAVADLMRRPVAVPNGEKVVVEIREVRCDEK